MSDIEANLDGIVRRIADNAMDLKNVRLVAVSKRQPIEAIVEAYRCGQRDFGENYVQELADKAQLARERGLDAIRWHFIGHLQRNKVRKLVTEVQPSLIHSVDSLPLAEKIDRCAGDCGRVQDVLIELRLGDEATAKTGLAPEQLDALASAIDGMAHVRLRGLMLIAAMGDEACRHADFQRLAALTQRVAERYHIDDAECSMGMTDDYEIALAHGATLVRIGRAIFADRVNV